MSPRRMNQILKGALVAIVVAVAVGLYFSNKTLTNIAVKTAHLKAEVEVGQEQIKTYQQTKVKVDSLSFVNDLANQVLPPDEDQSTIVAEVSQFAVRTHLAVSAISFADNSSPTSSSSGSSSKSDTKKGLAIPKGVTAIPITVQLQPGAKYSDLLSFLKMIETNQRKMQVTNITLQPDAVDRSQLSQVSIAINLYARSSPGAKK